MKSVRKFFIGIAVFFLLGIPLLFSSILVPIDRNREGGLFRPRNTAVYRVIYGQNNTVTYYGENREVLQIDAMYNMRTLVGTTDTVGDTLISRNFYLPGKQKEPLLSEKIVYHEIIHFTRYFYTDGELAGSWVTYFTLDELLQSQFGEWHFYDAEGQSIVIDGARSAPVPEEEYEEIREKVMTPAYSYPEMEKTIWYNSNFWN